MLVFDVTSRESFEALDGWLKEMRDHNGSNACPVVLMANKVDKPKRVIDEATGRAYATKRGHAYFETSASTGGGVEDAFEHIFAAMLERTNSGKSKFQAAVAGVKSGAVMGRK